MAEDFIERLAARKIWMIGTDREVTDTIVQILQNSNKVLSAGFDITKSVNTKWTEMVRHQLMQAHKVRSGDYVILVCRMSGNDSHIVGESDRYIWQELVALSGLLEDLKKSDPAAVLLLSDAMVYGKVFGAAHALKEDELGYVCHTDPKDAAVQCMRTMEHLCSRLGREEGFPVKMARVDWDILRKPGDLPEGIYEQLAYHMLKVLLKGASGEAYNLPGAEELKAAAENPERTVETARPGQDFPDRSPLSPIPIIPDTGKAGRL